MIKKILIILIILINTSCSLKNVVKHHGVHFLEKKQTKLKILETNTNDTKKILGHPSTKNTFDNDVWIYIERKISNTHFFGRRKLIVNNVMVLEIDDKGVLAKKDFYNIDDMKDIKFDDQRSETLQKRNFIYNFLSSMRQRINDPLGVRKKRRQGQ